MKRCIIKDCQQLLGGEGPLVLLRVEALVFHNLLVCLVLGGQIVVLLTGCSIANSGLSLAPLEANGTHVPVEDPGSHLPPLQPHDHGVLGPSGELGLGDSWGVRLLVEAAD